VLVPVQGKQGSKAAGESLVKLLTHIASCLAAQSAALSIASKHPADNMIVVIVKSPCIALSPHPLAGSGNCLISCNVVDKTEAFDHKAISSLWNPLSAHSPWVNSEGCEMVGVEFVLPSGC